MSDAAPKLLLIDGLSLAFRAFYALPTDLATPNGTVTNAVYGFTSMLLNLLLDHKPDHVAVVFDRPEPTFRHEAEAEYKANREAAPHILREQMGLVRQMVDVLRMPDVRVVVEFEPQSRMEGEVQQMEPGFPVIEFADITRGTVTGRRSAQDITVFDSVGFALEDYSALCFLHQLLQEQRALRRDIDLVPTLQDPKDLFGGTLGGGRARLRIAG